MPAFGHLKALICAAAATMSPGYMPGNTLRCRVFDAPRN